MTFIKSGYLETQQIENNLPRLKEFVKVLHEASNQKVSWVDKTGRNRIIALGYIESTVRCIQWVLSNKEVRTVDTVISNVTLLINESLEKSIMSKRQFQKFLLQPNPLQYYKQVSEMAIIETFSSVPFVDPKAIAFYFNAFMKGQLIGEQTDYVLDL